MPSLTPPPRVLFVAATPRRDISTEQEFKRVRTVFRSLPGIELQPVLCASIDDLQEELIAHDFDFVHLVAHGSPENVELEDGSPWGQDVPARFVIELVQQHQSVRCIVLNACDSACWITEPLGPALVAMRGPIGDDAALEFSVAFYQSVAAGHSPEVAFTQGVIRALRNAPNGNFKPEFWPACFGVIGIRGRSQYKDDNHIRCQFLCSLEQYFPQNQEPDWSGACQALERFLDSDDIQTELNRRECHISFDCPMDFALLAGRRLGPHANTYPLQSRPYRELWRPDHSRPMPSDSPWHVRQQRSSPMARKLVVSLSVSQDTTPLVGAHLDRLGEPVHWIDIRPIGGAYPHAVRGADHGNALARTLAQELPKLRTKYECDQIDLFFAAPNAFMFLLGQQGSCLGTLNLHCKVPGEDKYQPSFTSVARYHPDVQPRGPRHQGVSK